MIQKVAAVVPNTPAPIQLCDEWKAEGDDCRHEPRDLERDETGVKMEKAVTDRRNGANSGSA